MTLDNDLAPPPAPSLKALADEREAEQRRQGRKVAAVVLAARWQWAEQPETIGPALRAALVALERKGRAG